jgi:hypothetical protein
LQGGLFLDGSRISRCCPAGDLAAVEAAIPPTILLLLLLLPEY